MCVCFGGGEGGGGVGKRGSVRVKGGEVVVKEPHISLVGSLESSYSSLASRCWDA